MKPIVSVLLPTFARRAGGYLERSIESVLAQTHRELELLVVDDGSTDGSGDLIDRYARQDGRVQHIRFDTNVGLPALTLGLAYAQTHGDLIAFTFDDCTLLPEHLERLVETLEQAPDAKMAYGQAELRWMSGQSMVIGKPYNEADMRIGNNHVPNGAVMLRRSLVEEVGWYDPHVILKRFCDWDLWQRIGAVTRPIFVPEILTREEGESLKDSLGSTVTVFRDLMLRYSRIDRNAQLRPEQLRDYDPFRLDVMSPMSDEDCADLRFLVTEHLLKVGDTGRLAALAGEPNGLTESAILAIKSEYLGCRIQILTRERNDAHFTLFSLQSTAKAESDALREEIRLIRAHYEAETAALRTEAQALRAEAQALQPITKAESDALREENRFIRAHYEAEAAARRAEAHALRAEAQALQSITKAESDALREEIRLVRAHYEAETAALRAEAHALRAEAQALQSITKAESDALREEIRLIRAHYEAETAALRAEAHALRAEAQALRKEAELVRVDYEEQGVALRSAQDAERVMTLASKQERETSVKRRRAWEQEKGELEERLAAMEVLMIEHERERSNLDRRLIAERENFMQERAALEHCVNDAQGRADRAVEDLEAVLTSTSWRLTRPVRRLKRLTARVQGAPEQPRTAAPDGGSPVQNLTHDARDALLNDSSSAPILPGGGDASHSLTDAAASAEVPGLRIVAIGDGPISPVELCLNLPLAYMAREFGVRYELFYQNEPPSREVWSKADVIVMMRLTTTAMATLAESASELDIPVVYMTDDDLELVEPGSQLAQHYARMNAFENIGRLIRAASLTVVFSDALYRKFSPGARAIVLAPAIAGIEFFDAMPDAQRPEHEHEEIRLGYAGSPTHANDIALIAGVLADLLEQHSRLVVETIGQPVAALKNHPRYRHFEIASGLSAFSALQQERCWDIGLGPLQLTAFNEAKTDNKYRAYAAAGIPGVYSRIAPFERSVEDGRTGILVENDETAWRDAIERLIRNAPERARIAEAARRDVRRRYGLGVVASHYHGLFLNVAGGLKVIVAGPLHLPTVHIDIRIPFAELRQRDVLRHRMREPADVTDADLTWAQVLVIVRSTEPAVQDLMDRAQARGVKVVYSWDDDFFNIPEEHKELRAYYHDPVNRRSLEAILTRADLVKASTPRLADISRRYTERVMTAPYGFDMSLVPSDLKPRPDDRLRIGYFGTAGRGAEFGCVMEALRRIQVEHPDVDLEFFGFSPEGTRTLPRTTYIPFLDDYDGSIGALAERQWDIGLAPLGITNIARAKLPTKYRDYGATGAAGVYTDIETYWRVVRDGETGLLTDNTVEGWYAAIKRLIVEPSLRRRIADAAFVDVRDNYGLDRPLKAWKDAFRRIGFAVPRDEPSSGLDKDRLVMTPDGL